MPDLPLDNQLHQVIEGYTIEEPLRPYLGYSLLGHECDRYKWYSFRWCFKNILKPRNRRLLDRGHQEERVLVRELENVGVACSKVLDDQEEVVGTFGHAKGHPDGRLLGVPTAEKTEHLLECKAMAEKYFKEIVKFGVERAQPAYYVQVQMYMGKLKLKRCLFCVTNKNTDHRHYERIHFDQETYNKYDDLATDIVMSTEPPKRMSESPEWYQCKHYPCPAYGICHLGEQVEDNCRTCTQSEILNDGKWGCRTYQSAGPIPIETQRAGCPARKPLLVPG